MKRKLLLIITILFVAIALSSCNTMRPVKKPVYDGQSLERYHKKLQRYYAKNKETTGKFVK